ncbi:hypothetical protein GCM10010218_12450 [Streptomyces mashuensis]|uniref:Uncharacterized protein n=1 Tax=Streptomyces mashuensis TaxID=33904 RepID=A0A919B0M7_9ACTN|nr:hypothetical protein [Streptomyces mashuensis]GHF32895.1 hypothetical protein GCM10010218_12450 [Streptomyces mashuensis]
MKPLDADAALALVRAKAAEWQENAARTRTLGADESLGWHVDRMGERDDMAMELIETWRILDETMTRNHGLDRPEAWHVPQLTDEQFAHAFADWPELAVFGKDLVKDLCRHHGIRYVRWLAQCAVKNAPALAAPSSSADEDACTCVTHCDEAEGGCRLAGRRHVHPRTRTGQYGPCPEHPDAPGDL